ncbi:MAG: hypothetical protein ACJ746_28765 [Bryobacteraceae bacterium]
MRTPLAVLVLCTALSAQTESRFQPGIRPFVSIDDSQIALLHVRVIDGTGGAPAEDQTILINKGQIAALGPSATLAVPDRARRLELAGHTVIPGLVGMHEHLFYPSGEGIPTYNEQAFSFPRLYLANGVTTARTAGSMEPATDMKVKELVDAGKMPGPKMYITGPYLEGSALTFSRCFHCGLRMMHVRQSITGPTWALRHSRRTCTSRARNSLPPSKKRTSAESRSRDISARLAFGRLLRSESTISNMGS